MNISIKNKIILITAIVILAAASIGLRIFYMLNTPVHVDEASLGYESYSLIQTGADRFGNKWPVHFYNFGWGQNATLSYILIPIIKIFGLNIIAIRLTVFAINLLAVFMTYLLGKELFNKKIGFLAGFLLLISPWDIYLSSTAFNPCLLPFLYTANFYFLIKFFKENKGKYLFYAAILSAISLYTYALSFFWIPLSYLLILFIYKEKINSRKKIIALNSLVFLILSFPIIIFYLKNQFDISQISNLWFFSLPSLETTRFNMLSSYNWGGPTLFFFNFILQYFFHVSIIPFSLMMTGYYDLLTVGGIYFFEIIIIFFGIFTIIKERLIKTNYNFLLGALLLAPIPASFLLFDIYNNTIIHPLRSITLLPFIQILGAIGFYSIFEKNYRGKKLQHIMIIAVILNFIFVSSYFYLNYSRDGRLKQREKIIRFIKENEYKYNKIIIIDYLNIDLNYIYLLFNLKINPTEAQKADLKPYKESDISLGKYIFANSKNYHFDEGKILYIKEKDENEEEIDIIKEFSENKKIILFESNNQKK